MLAAALRLWALVRDGGARTAAMVYDDGVYVSAGALLRDGHLPYRDFAFVQPPGLAYLITLVSAVCRDPEQLLITMRYLSIVVGVANVALIALVVRRHIGPVEAAVAALAYAVLPEAVYAEHAVILEPWLNLACLAAVHVWLSIGDGTATDDTATDDGTETDDAATRARRRGRARLAGVLLAVALSIKLWAIFCVVACVVAAPRRARRQRLGDLTLGAGVGLVLLWLPLLLVARGNLLDHVVRFQLERPADGVDNRLSRLWRMAKPSEITDAGWWRAAFVLAVVFVGVHAAIRTASRGSRVAQLALAWFALTIVAFLLSSTWWEQYSAHLAAPFALLVGLATHGVVASVGAPERGPLPSARRRAGLTAAAIALLALFVVDSLRYDAEHSPVDVDAARDIERFVPDGSCVVALEPGWLVMAGRLPRVDDAQRFSVDPYAARILGEDFTAAIATCPYLVVSDFRLSMLPPELQRTIETEFVTRSDPTAGIRVLERR